MKNIIKFSILILIFLLCFNSKAQTTAMDFQGVDCNNNHVHLFSDLDAGKAVMIIYYMANCGSCPPVAQKMEAMAENINLSHPGLVKAYAFPYNNTTTCSTSASWVTSNNLPLFAPMDSGVVQVAYYGGFGMPTAVLLGGENHEVLFNTQNFVTSDTTTMHNLILGMLNAKTEELKTDLNVNIYPNPASSLIYLEFELLNNAETQVEIVDLSGKQILILDKENFEAGKNKKSINISSISSGSYIVNLKLDGKLSKSEKLNIIH